MGCVTWPCRGRIYSLCISSSGRCVTASSGRQETTSSSSAQWSNSWSTFGRLQNRHGLNKVVSSWEKSREVSLFFFPSSSVHQLNSHRGLCLFWFQYSATSSPAETKPCVPRLRSPGKSPLCQVRLCVTEKLQKLEESVSREKLVQQSY